MQDSREKTRPSEWQSLIEEKKETGRIIVLGACEFLIVFALTGQEISAAMTVMQHTPFSGPSRVPPSRRINRIVNRLQ